jgi:hypothetical protein
VAWSCEYYGDATLDGDPDVDAASGLVAAASNDLQVSSCRQYGFVCLLELQDEPFDQADSTA